MSRSDAARPQQPDALHRNAAQTPATLWIAVALLVVSACGLGGFVVSLDGAAVWVRWSLLVVAVGCASTGLWLARRGHMMQDVS